MVKSFFIKVDVFWLDISLTAYQLFSYTLKNKTILNVPKN